MASLRSSFVVPTLLAGAALLAGCDSNERDARSDLEGMTDVIAAACPTENKDTQSRLHCATVAQAQATKLFEYSGLGEQFQKSCTFKGVSSAVPSFAAPLVIGARVDRCLKTIGATASDEVVRNTAHDIRRTMKASLGA